LKHRGIEVVNMQSRECQDLMEKFIKEKPEVWYVDSAGHKQYAENVDRNEDIGEEERVHSKEQK